LVTFLLEVDSKMPWTINWDNGESACGTWGHLAFESEEDARAYAESTTHDYIAEGIWSEYGYAEPYLIEPVPSSEEAEAMAEESLDYFNHYIAGDR